MNDISVKSTGVLIDELLTTLIRCWWNQEVVMTETDPEKVAVAARRAQETNARRNALIRAIDQRLGEGEITALVKTYDDAYFREKFEEEKYE